MKEEIAGLVGEREIRRIQTRIRRPIMAIKTLALLEPRIILNPIKINISGQSLKI